MDVQGGVFSSDRYEDENLRGVYFVSLFFFHFIIVIMIMKDDDDNDNDKKSISPDEKGGASPKVDQPDDQPLSGSPTL